MEKEEFKGLFLKWLNLDIIQELVFSGIGCALMYLIYSFFPKQYWNKTYRITFILILTLSFFFIFIILNQEHSENKLFKIDFKKNIILFSIFNFAGYLFLFYNAHWGYNGLVGDNVYRTAYITRMAHSGYPKDFGYKDLSAFYAPLYWYFLALISILFQIPPYKMIRVGLLVTAFLVPIILFETWKKIYSVKIAFTITIVSSIFLTSIYSIDHTLGAFFIIPYFMYYFENCTGKRFTKKDYVLAGIFGSIVFCTFFFYFLVIPFYYLISFIQNSNEFKKKLKHLVYTTITLILFSSWFWAPLLKDIILIGFESHQNRYFQPDMLIYPLLVYIGFSINPVGMIYIIRKYKNSYDFKILGNLILSIHIAFLLGFFGVLIGFPILHDRLMKLSGYILFVSSSIFYVRFFVFIAENGILRKNNININLHQVEIYIMITIMISQLNAHWSYITGSPGYDAAHKGNSMAEEREIFEELDYEDKVFLTNEWEIIMFLPLYLFLLPNPYYSHPSALYNERVEFLVKLSECKSSKEFYDMIIDNKFGPIDYFYLDLNDNGTKLVFEVAVETFPDGREYYEIEFEIELFQDEDLFKLIEIDGELIYKTKY